MRVNLPRTPRQLAIAVGLVGLIALLTPLWFAQLAMSRLRTTRRQQTVGDVPRVDIADADLDALIKARRPVVITGLIDSLDLDVVPDVDGFRSLGRDGAVAPFTVKTHRDTAPFFLYRGDYGAELDHATTMQLDEFADFMFDNEQAPGTCTYRLFGVNDLDGRVRAIVDDIAARLRPLTSIVPDPRASGLWIGSRNVVTPLHHDAWTGLLFQFHGAKRIRMFAPADRANLSFSSPWSPTAVWSTLPGRSAEADPDRFPRFANATPFDATLESGEVLYIPPFWAHEIEALEPNISMPFRFKAGPREYLDPGFLIPAYEIFDAKFLRPRELTK